MKLLGLISHLVVWGYLLLLMIAWVIINRDGERWWLATLVLFGPRWLFAVPLVLIVPLLWFARRRLLWVVTVEMIALLLFILNFELPWRPLTLSATGTPSLRLITCNTHRDHVDVVKLAELVQHQRPDLLVLQEWTSDQAIQLFSAPQWHCRIDGDMLVASHFPIEYAVNVMPPHSGLEGAIVSYRISLPTGPVQLVNVHLASPHLEFSEALHRAPGASDGIADNCLERRIESNLLWTCAKNSGLPTLLAGDFNTPIDSETFRQSWMGMTDAFAFAGFGTGVTYRVRWTRTRIDHIVFDKNWQCRHCWLGSDVGSPHLPVIADLGLKR